MLKQVRNDNFYICGNPKVHLRSNYRGAQDFISGNETTFYKEKYGSTALMGLESCISGLLTGLMIDRLIID